MQQDQSSLATFSKPVPVSEAEHQRIQGTEWALHWIFLPSVLAVTILSLL